MLRYLSWALSLVCLAPYWDQAKGYKRTKNVHTVNLQGPNSLCRIDTVYSSGWQPPDLFLQVATRLAFLRYLGAIQ